MAELPESAYVVPGGSLGIELVEEIDSKILVRAAGLEHHVDDLKERVPNGDERFLFSASLAESRVLSGEIRLLGVACCPGGLYESRA